MIIFRWNINLLMVLHPKLIKLNWDTTATPPPPTTTTITTTTTKYCSIIKHVHIFNTQKLHFCSPNRLRQVGGGGKAILCNHDDPGAKRWESIWYTKFLASKILLRQLSTRKWHDCAAFVKSLRFSIEWKQSISNIFWICHILWYFQDGCHWPWKFYMSKKIETCSDFCDNSVKLFVLS